MKQKTKGYDHELADRITQCVEFVSTRKK